MLIDGRTRSAVLMLSTLASLLFGVNVAGSELPSWVKAPPPDNDSVMYGVGDGKDRSSANTSALAAIAGALMTKVQGSTYVNLTQNKYGTEERVAVTVQTTIQDAALSHYRIVEAEKVSRRWYVLLELDRKALFSDATTNLKEVDAKLASMMLRYGSLSRLERYLGKNEFVAQLHDSRSALDFAQTVGPDFQGLEYVERYQEYENQIAWSTQELAFRVTSDELAVPFTKKLVNLLGKESLRARLGQPEAGYVTVSVSSEQRKFDLGKSKQVRLTLLLTTTDERGKHLASTERVGVGESLTSYESASRQASSKLARICESKGTISCLGL